MMSGGEKLLKEVQIGSVRVETPVALGPMAGVTDLPFRLLCKEQGAGLLYTEMVSAKAILYHNRNTEALMTVDDREHPIALQLFGSEPDIVAEAAVQIEEKNFDIYDFNMGCPVPKVVNNGEGSALMRDPKRAAKIISAIVRRVHKPVTVKIRRGFNEEEVNAVEVAKILEDAGAAAIAVHGRTREQYYTGKADREIIRQVKNAVSIPVFGNGDIDSPESAVSMIRDTGVDGIMAARFARGNPWLFASIRAAINGEEMPAPPTGEDVYRMICRHAEMLVKYKDPYTGVREMRKHIAWYTAGFPHSAALRRRTNEIEDLEGLKQVVYEALCDPFGKNF